MLNPRAVLVPVIASLFLAACGGEEGPTREEFAKSADDICRDLSQTTEEIAAPENPGELAGFADTLTREVDGAVKRVKALEVPEGDAGEKAKQFQDAIEADANDKIKPALTDLKEAAEARDEKQIVSAGERLQAVKTPESDKLAREIGAQQCAD